MEVRSLEFRKRVAERVGDDGLQSKLASARRLFVDGRARAVAAYGADGGDFEALRAEGEAIRNDVLAELDQWLLRFETQVSQRGGQVRWARNGAEVARQVIDIARQHGVKKATKSKSMLSEEAGLNEALEAAGIAAIETDLGEYIIQLAKETPSHIIAPAIHKNKEEVADLFHEYHGTPRQTDIPALTREARAVLRQHFLSADMGITGANFLVAETGAVALVTNEGNGRMVTTLPRVHVVVVGVEKVIRNFSDLSLLLRLLTRSATGQSISNYVSLLTGTRGAGEQDGPEHLYVILVDNGRAGLLGGEFEPMLRCIRCGACMNHCPVYQTVGGHAYGWVYPGPMGSVLTPLYTGLDKAPDLPQAATLCGQCSVVCPVRIPLPELLRKLREKQMAVGLRPRGERLGLKVWAWFALHPRWYRAATAVASRYLRWLSGGGDRIQVLGLAPEWTASRDLPAPRGPTFHQQLARRRAARKS